MGFILLMDFMFENKRENILFQAFNQKPRDFSTMIIKY